MPALPLSEVRGVCAAALAPQTDADPPVLMDLVDSITPPVLMLEWNDPWLSMESIAGSLGIWTATLNVIAFAGRVEPGAGVAVLEQLVVLVLTRLQADQNSWPLSSAQAPRRFDMGNVSYLGLRLSFQPQVSIG